MRSGHGGRFVRWIALVQSPEHVCCRYRLTAFLPFLSKAGYDIEPTLLPRRPWQCFALSARLRHFDGVILQRKLLPYWQFCLLRRLSQRLIFDVDDSVFLRDSYATRGLLERRRQRRFAAVCRNADFIVAGNSFLERAAATNGAVGRVGVIPTCVNPELYRVANHARHGAGVELAWIGSSSTLQGIAAIHAQLESVGQEVPGLRFKMICDRFLCFRNLTVIEIAWNETVEAEALSSADIGISWIPDDDWSRGKCGLKVLQYMAAGLPVVGNPVGVQAEMIIPGKTGFLVANAAEWRDAIRQLANDPKLRSRMGQAGRQLVENHYSVAVGACLWRQSLDRLGSSSLRAA